MHGVLENFNSHNPLDTEFLKIMTGEPPPLLTLDVTSIFQSPVIVDRVSRIRIEQWVGCCSLIARSSGCVRNQPLIRSELPGINMRRIYWVGVKAEL